MVTVLVAVGFGWFALNRYAGNITRVPGVFSALDASSRPAPPTPVAGTSDIPMTFLLVGIDSGVNDPATEATEGSTQPGPRTDIGESHPQVLMLVQLSADRRSAVTVSIPENSTVPVPGYGTADFTTAFLNGGPTLLVQTVEAVTDVRIDHYVSVDFAGFAEVTDAVGGVDVRLPEATEVHGVSFSKGRNHLGGGAALAYVRQWSGQPGAELDRANRQHNYLRALLTAVARDNLLTDPGRLDDFLLALTSALSVDDELSNMQVASLALDLRRLQPPDVAFLTVPVAGAQRQPGGNVVTLDVPRADLMWSYLKTGSLQDHVMDFDQLPNAPR